MCRAIEEGFYNFICKFTLYHFFCFRYRYPEKSSSRYTWHNYRKSFIFYFYLKWYFLNDTSICIYSNRFIFV